MGEHWLDMDPTLGRPPPPSPWDSSDRRRTRRNNRLIDMGVHPATRKPIADTDESCGTCAHLTTSKRRSSKTHYKCGLVAATAGPGTDIRLKWPACESWVAADG